MDRISRSWDRLAEIDAKWIILTEPEKLGSWSDAEFYATGVELIDTVLEKIRSLGLPVKRGRALDFGCGLGRLTKALAAHFDSVVGVDVSSKMVDTAKRVAPAPNIEYVANAASDLCFVADASIDFVFSWITLQHIRPRLIRSYLGEFARIAAGDGLIVFQLFDRAPKLAARLRYFLIRLAVAIAPIPLLRAIRRARYPGAREETVAALPRKMFEVHGLSPKDVRRTLMQAGAELVSQQVDESHGTEWRSWMYVARKSSASSKLT